MPKKNVVIIGSGIGGSGIAALLAHSGEYEVDLYEKNNIIGGRFASFTKEGFRLDIGCHLIANCDNGNLGQILKMLGQPDAVKWRYATNPRPVFNYKGERVKFPHEIYKLGFTDEQIQKIMQFYAEMNSISEDQYDEYDKKDMLTQLEKYIKDDKARAIFGMLSGIYFVVADYETPVGEWVRCNRDFITIDTPGYPIGGTGAVPEAYVRIMGEHGGRMHLSTPIKRIVVEDKKVKGVELKDGSQKAADIVISNAGLIPTVNFLVGREHYGKEFLQKVDAYVYSEGAFMVKVALNEPVVERETMIMYIGRDDMATMEKEAEAGIIPEVMPHLMIPIISNLDPSAAPQGRQLLIAGGGTRLSFNTSKEDWKKLDQAVLRALEIVFPGIGKHIMWTSTTSPADINNMFGENGNVIGIAQKLGQVGPNRPPLKDPEIENLYHCSADSGLHGIGGELAADSALRLYELLMK